MKPKLLRPFEFEYICEYLKTNDLYLSPKADGINDYIKYEGKGAECEYIPETKKFLVYDNFLNSKLVKSIDEILEVLKKHDKEYLENKVCVKPIFKLMYFSKKMLVQLLKLDNLLSYKTDGWIIQADKYLFKHKNFDKLSLDLKCIGRSYYCDYDDTLRLVFTNDYAIKEHYGKIIRCYFKKSYDTVKPYPAEIRYDKEKSNSFWIIRDIQELAEMNYLENYKESELTKYYTNTYRRTDPVLTDYLADKRYELNYNISRVLKYLIRNENINILDLGCGFYPIEKILDDRIIPKLNYIGVDIDPICISLQCQSRRNNNHFKYIWQDFNEFKSDKYFDLIILNHSINYFDTEKLKSLVEKHNPKYIIVGFINPELYDNINYDNKLVMNKLEGNKFNFYYDWMNKEFDEELRTFDEIRAILKNYEIKPQISESHYLRRDIKDGYVCHYNEEVNKFREINKCLIFNKSNIINNNG